MVDVSSLTNMFSQKTGALGSIAMTAINAVIAPTCLFLIRISKIIFNS